MNVSGDYRGLKRPGEGQQLEQHTPHGPDVGLKVVLDSLTQLRRHVVWRPDTLVDRTHQKKKKRFIFDYLCPHLLFITALFLFLHCLF